MGRKVTISVVDGLGVLFEKLEGLSVGREMEKRLVRMRRDPSKYMTPHMMTLVELDAVPVDIQISSARQVEALVKDDKAKPYYLIELRCLKTVDLSAMGIRDLVFAENAITTDDIRISLKLKVTGFSSITANSFEAEVTEDSIVVYSSTRP